MKQQERIAYIIEELGKSAGVSLHTLSTGLGVSDMTVRRDLEELRNKGYVTLIQGVAILNRNQDGSSIAKDYSLANERLIMTNEKMRIGKLAATLIEPQDTILIDTGTTTEQMLPYIPSDMPLSVVCYAINVLNSCIKHDSFSVYFAGGYYQRNTQSFDSSEGASLISRIVINKCFISAAGISSKGAVSCAEQYELPFKETAVKSSVEKILLADSSKFGKLRPCMFAKLSDIDLIITDKAISEQWLKTFDENGIKYMLA